MPSLFRRKATDPVAASAEAQGPSDESSAASPSRTLSKRERGVATPKRVVVRRTPTPPPANRREELRRRRDADRVEREERRKGMAAGDPRYLLARDRGPERAMVRDIVDSRFTVGTWFFGMTILQWLVLFVRVPTQAALGLQYLWLSLAVLTLLDCFILVRRIRRTLRERYPDTDQRMIGLGYYGIVRSITFRRMRMPKPRIKLGEKF